MSAMDQIPRRLNTVPPLHVILEEKQIILNVSDIASLEGQKALTFDA